MDVKKFIWNLLIYVVLIGVFFFGGFLLIFNLGVFKQIMIQEGLKFLFGMMVIEVVNIDGDQWVDMMFLKFFEGFENVQFYYVDVCVDEVVSVINEVVFKDGFNDVVLCVIWFDGFFLFFFLFVLFGLLFWWFLLFMQGGGGKVMQFGKFKVKFVNKEILMVIFVDVVGVDEVIEEFYEIKEFFQDLVKFQVIGVCILKGVLLYGFFGIGKIFFVCVVVGEVGVLFYLIFGFDFVEMFVGVGVFCVCDLFSQVKENVLVIIFIDEIDVVGCYCGVGMGGGNDECEQILNQMFVEMDGFDLNVNVIVIVVINCLDIFDFVLLCFGCFDCQIGVDVFDFKGCQKIFEVYSKGKLLLKNVDFEVVVCKILGFIGVDLVNVLNEVVLFMVCLNVQFIDNCVFDEVIDCVIVGLQCCICVMKDKEKFIMVYYEGGYVFVVVVMNYIDFVMKIMILFCGKVFGYMMVLLLDDKYLVICNELQDQFIYVMGGCVVEEIVFYDFIMGVLNDIEKVILIVCKMVIEYGMMMQVGLVKFGIEGGDMFVVCDMGCGCEYFEKVVEWVDVEVCVFIEQVYNEVYVVISENCDIFDKFVFVLFEEEIFDYNQIVEIFIEVKKFFECLLWLLSEDCLVFECLLIDVLKKDVLFVVLVEVFSSVLCIQQGLVGVGYLWFVMV